MLTITEIQDKQVWEEFLLRQPWTPFLQSWNTSLQYFWEGNRVFRLGLFDGEKLAGICLVIKIEARRGTYLYIPYGPILENWSNPEHFVFLTRYLKDLAKAERANFVKVSPYIEDTDNFKKMFGEAGFRRAPIHVLSETSWLLDLKPGEEELWANLRKTHRNLIRRAEKEGVTIETSKNIDDLDEFYKLYKETGGRHKFTLYPYSFIKNQLKAFLPEDQALIYSAKYNGETIASAVIMFYGREGAYHHGASSDKYSKIPASYLLQWQAILEAKRRGKEFYNFWGIYTGANPNHPFAGITTFKTGFGGSSRVMLPAYDLPVNWKYWINYAVEKIRKIKRGF